MIPAGYHTLTPSLTVHNAAEAIAFYQRAFGAEELGRAQAEDGKSIWHAEIKIGDSRLMLSDEFPQWGRGRSPQTLGATTASFHLYVEDVDAVFQRAVEAGATVSMPIENTFWGDRYGKVVDPFGHEWGIATRLENLSVEEQERRAREFYSGQSA